MTSELKSLIASLSSESGVIPTQSAILQKARELPRFSRVPEAALRASIKRLMGTEGEMLQKRGSPGEKGVGEGSGGGSDFFDAQPDRGLDDFGGFDELRAQLRDFVEINVRGRLSFGALGFSRGLRGLLLTGPGGSGKSALAAAVASEAGLPWLRAARGDRKMKILLGPAGLERLRAGPCLVFFDDLELFFEKEGDTADALKLLRLLDATSEDAVFVVGAIGKTELLPAPFFSLGRFEQRFDLALPDELTRFKILQSVLKSKKSAACLKKVAESSAGFVAADLSGLALRAAEIAVRQNETCLTDSHFYSALANFSPLLKREGFNAVPEITFDDVGSLNSLKAAFTRLVLRPISDPRACAEFGIRRAAGVLLWGPPGCGKTLLAKAVANAAKANFIYVKGPELLSKYVGESERAVRALFERARLSAPCLVFFDEIDGLVPKRRADENNVTERLVNQMLTEMNGLERLEQVYLIGATNRPDIIDRAILRPERLGVHLYVPLPDLDARVEIFQTLVRKKPLEESFDARKLLENDSERFSGADLAAVVDAAARAAAWGDEPSDVIKMQHFREALKAAKPSVSEQEIENMKKVAKEFS